jgi:hypothetical protein
LYECGDRHSHDGVARLARQSNLPLVIESALFATMDPRHRESIRLVEKRDGFPVLSFIDLDDQVEGLPNGIER